MKACVTATAVLAGLPVEVPGRFARSLRRADDFIRLAVAATARVLPEEKAQSATGLFLGTGFGPMQTNFDVLGLIVDEDQTSPTLFSHSVFNGAAGYIARLFEIPERSATFTDFSWPFFRALAEGCAAIERGELRRCLVLQVETYSDLLEEARQREGGEVAFWHAGAVAWLLSGEEPGNGPVLDEIDITTASAPAEKLLHRNDSLVCDTQTGGCTTPLAAAAALTSMINGAGPASAFSCRLTAPYGTVRLRFSGAAGR
ncbi:MAG: hypothetical protein Kow0089_05570 [Desulfobulbaceae bacterium]